MVVNCLILVLRLLPCCAHQGLVYFLGSGHLFLARETWHLPMLWLFSDQTRCFTQKQHQTEQQSAFTSSQAGPAWFCWILSARKVPAKQLVPSEQSLFSKCSWSSLQQNVIFAMLCVGNTRQFSCSVHRHTVKGFKWVVRQQLIAHSQSFEDYQ